MTDTCIRPITRHSASHYVTDTCAKLTLDFLVTDVTPFSTANAHPAVIFNDCTATFESTNRASDHSKNLCHLQAHLYSSPAIFLSHPQMLASGGSDPHGQPFDCTCISMHLFVKLTVGEISVWQRFALRNPCIQVCGYAGHCCPIVFCQTC